MAETKPIPEMPEAEWSLVSCVHAGFRAQDAIADRALFAVEPEAFRVPQARAVWAAMQSLYKKSQPIDPMTLKGELGRLGLDTVVGGFVGLTELLAYDEFGSPEPLARQVREMHDRREMLRIAAILDKNARALDVDPATSRGDVSTALMALDLGSQERKRRSGVDLIHRLADGKPFRGEKGGEKLLYFPFDPWNDEVECAPGHVIVLGAGPKTGKTALAIDCMVHTAKRGLDIGFISLEMDNDEVEARLSGRLTGQNSRLFLKATWDHAVVAPALQRGDIIMRLHWWCHPSGVPWGRVEAEIREMVRINGVRSVIIDYFTLIGKPTGRKSQNDAALWGEVSTAIKRLAQELEICILLLSQLKREGQDGEPFQTDLKETSQLQQDANAIIFLWHPSEGSKDVWGKVSDNRSGLPVDKRQLQFDGATCRFSWGVKTTENGSLPSGW